MFQKMSVMKKVGLLTSMLFGSIALGVWGGSHAYAIVADQIIYTTNATGQPASGDSLMRANVDGNGSIVISDNDSIFYPGSVALDPANHRAFVGDLYNNHGGIYAVDLITGVVTKIYDSPYQVTDLAADTVNQKLYFTTNATGQPAVGDTLSRINFDGSGMTAILNNDSIQYPKGIALDLPNNRAFVGDLYNGHGGIYAVELSTGAPTLLYSSAYQVTSLYADRVNQKLYFTTNATGQPAAGDTLSRVNFDGTRMTVILNNNTIQYPQGIALDLAGNRAYVGDLYNGHSGIYAVDLTTRTPALIVPSASQVTSIALADNNPPAVTNETISTSGISQTGLILNWNKAIDNISPQKGLQYRVYQSSSSNLNTVEDMEAFGTAMGSYTSDIATVNVTGLTPGTSYYYNVMVKDEYGNKSAYKMTMAITSSVTAPTAPVIEVATAGNSQATVSFIPPVSDGGSAITSYTVTSNPGGLTATDAGSPITVTGLTNGTAYTFTVTATNAVGTSVPSASSNSVTPKTVPSAPTIGSVAASDGQVTVSFIPPASNGGSSITSYTVTSNPGGLTATDAGSPITVTGLTNGTAYTFTVTATNAAGNSVSSASSASVKPLSSNAKLSSLSISDVLLNPAFTPVATNYTATVSNRVYSTSVTASVYDPTATIQVNGVALTSGTTSDAIGLNVGSNMITVLVTAQDLSTKAYTIKVDRAANNNAELRNLSLSNADLSPSFAAGTTSYTVFVNHAVSSTSVTADVYDANAIVKVNGIELSSGSSSQAINLYSGTNTIRVQVTAQNGTTQTYTVLVTRNGRESSDSSSQTPSSPASLTTPPATTEPDAPKPDTHIFKDNVDEVQLVSFLKDKLAQAKSNPAIIHLSDIANHWSKDTINLFVKLGFVAGYEDGSFHPDANMTRAEFAALISKAFNFSAQSTSTAFVFSDVDNRFWANEAIIALVSHGIINGYEDGTFKPDKTITRAEIIAIICRLVNVSAVNHENRGTFKDIEGTWNASQIQAAFEAGLVQGRDASTFAPEASTTKAESLTLIVRVLELNPEIKILLDELKM
ncbi:S-layer homology domain-containing protein [Paenibacillus aestuarii]|uniref:S-layer homology domain-containing protein n=1 Tax=Paenibacillus aestuarii TaxID=516965 RepID=A0ABW0KFV2_9BACL|nr:S-layer homology domain-containing protein [Paenibacillus aestuarii]